MNKKIIKTPYKLRNNRGIVGNVYNGGTDINSSEYKSWLESLFNLNEDTLSINNILKVNDLQTKNGIKYVDDEGDIISSLSYNDSNWQIDNNNIWHEGNFNPNLKLDKLKFDELFEKVTVNGTTIIRAKYTFASIGDVIAYNTSGSSLPSIFDNLPIASKTSKGIVQIGNGININNGIISLDSTAITPTLSFSNNILSVNGSTINLSSLSTDLSNYYIKSEINNFLNLKADVNGSSTNDFSVKNLFVYGTVNHWLADVITIADARLQLNNQQDGAQVSAGLDIYNGYNVIGTLHYNNGVWQANNSNIITDDTINSKSVSYAVNSGSATKIGTYSIADLWHKNNFNPNSKANTSHTHAQSDINNTTGWITTALNGKQPAGSYLTTTGTAANSSKLGGIVAGNYYHSGNANKNTVDWSANNLNAQQLNLTSSKAGNYWIVDAKSSLVDIGQSVGIKLANGYTGDTGKWCAIASMVTQPHANGNALVFYSNAAERMRLTYDGNVGIGTTSPTQRLHVNGNILATGEVTAYSDRRLKSNITPLEESLPKVMNLNPVRYIKDDKPSIGVIAQDLQQLYPELVTDGEYLSVNYAQLTAVIIKAIQELKSEFDNFKNNKKTE